MVMVAGVGVGVVSVPSSPRQLGALEVCASPIRSQAPCGQGFLFPSPSLLKIWVAGDQSRGAATPGSGDRRRCQVRRSGVGGGPLPVTLCGVRGSFPQGR